MNINANGTNVTIDGSLDVSLPLVILLHGWGGSSLDMTDPLTSRSGYAFDRTSGASLFTNEGVHFTPPATPVSGFFIDPQFNAVTSWKAALQAAGFTTATYSMKGASAAVASPIGADAMQLGDVVKALMAAPALENMRFAMLAHSRGGLVARSFLTSTISDPSLSAFMARFTTLITLHTPNAGTGLATDAASIASLLTRLSVALGSIGVATPGFIASTLAMLTDPALAEMAPGNSVLTGIAAREPVPGVIYNTFGGTSTDWVRIWARAFAPLSYFPLFGFLPVFDWSTTTLQIGTLLNYGSFLPEQFILGPIPGITEVTTVLAALAATTPELRPGAGDTLVSDAGARLPFSSHRTNPLNHMEALYDAGLQRQVIALLSTFRSLIFSGRAIATLHPFPARTTAVTRYTVTAQDAVSGVSLNPTTVRVRDGRGNVEFAVSGNSFAALLRTKIIKVLNPDTRKLESETLIPGVEIDLPPPYGTVGVPTGLS